MIARQTGEVSTSLHILRYSWTHTYRPTRDAVHVHERCKVNVFGVVREEGVIFAEYFDHLLDKAPRVRLGAVELRRPHMLQKRLSHLVVRLITRIVGFVNGVAASFGKSSELPPDELHG